MQSLPHVYALQQPQLHKDSSVLDLSHPLLFQTFKPVVTTGDGNCLYHALSLTLTGSESCTPLMRLLTAHALVKHKEIMLSAFACAYPSSSFEDHKLKFETALFKAVRVSDWGTDYHIFALSMLLNRPIFQYSMTLIILRFQTLSHLNSLYSTLPHANLVPHATCCTVLVSTKQCWLLVMSVTFHSCPLLFLICKITTG